jgi:DNA-binding MarR family transcriptional regulator
MSTPSKKQKMKVTIDIEEMAAQKLSLREAVIAEVAKTVNGKVTTAKVARRIEVLNIKPDAIYRILSSLDKKGVIVFQRKPTFGRKREWDIKPNTCQQ